MVNKPLIRPAISGGGYVARGGRLTIAMKHRLVPMTLGERLRFQEILSSGKLIDSFRRILDPPTYLPWASTSIKIMVDPIWMIKTLR